MKKNRPYAAYGFKQFFALFLLFTATHAVRAQTTALVCNDLVIISLEANCTGTVSAGDILEGGPYFPFDHYIVEMDKVLPLGNGPWVPAIATAADIGKNYQVRVTDPTTGNKCWGNIKFNTYLQCTGLTTINLDAAGMATLTPASMQTVLADACVGANTPFITQVNGQSSLALDCDDLGISTVYLQTSDQLGNSNACYASVLVADPSAVCNNCVICPPAVTITFDQAVNVLLPALQSGNLSAFDSFGDAQFNSACTFTDSTYTVTYHPSALGENWFSRSWVGLGPSNTVVGACEQPIIFVFDQNITVSGTVFLDTIENCLKDTDEPGFSPLKVVATKLPSNLKITQTPDANGAYSLSFDTNGLDSVIVVELQLPNGVNIACPNILVIPTTTSVQQFFMDFGVQAETLCPKMEVSLGVPLMRRCVNNTYVVQYCNTGLITATNASVTVTLDDLLDITSSTIPWSIVTNKTYTFPIGDVAPLHCGTFNVVAMLSCNTPIGQSICSEAIVYPNGPCGEPWDGPTIQTTAHCDGDSVSLVILNTGTQNMTEALDFIVIEDIIMYRQGEFQLNAGDSVRITMEANGATWRIEAAQVAGNPIADAPSSSIESCGGLTPGLVNAFPPNDGPDYIDISCEVARAAFDPNDKAAVPTGYGSANTIRSNVPLEYKIRFQNTGNDTAFRIVIVDTLSQNLDFASIEAGASSHPYQLKVYQDGILHFIFDPIMLPDSNVNEPASHGFVSFRIAQKPDLPIGTQLLNTANIYFDFNEAVVTNTVLHTIGLPFVTVETQQPYQPGVSIAVQPNPLADWSDVVVTGTALKQGLLTLYDPHGRPVQVQHFEGNTCKIERQALTSGFYFIRITDGGRAITSAKLTVQ